MYGLLKAYYIFLIYSIFGKYLISVPDTVSDVLVVGFIVLSLYFDRYQLQIPRKLGNLCFCTTILPAALILVFSLGVQLLGAFGTDYLVRSATLCIRWILYCLLAVRTVHTFKEKSADTLLLSCTVAYVPSIIVYFLQNGIINGISLLFSDVAYGEAVTLEVHRVTYVFGFLSVYYLYQLIIGKKRVLPQTLLSVALLMLGVKRVANFALVIALVIILLIKLFRNEKSRFKFVCIASVSLLAVALVFVYAIKSGYLQAVFKYLGIEDNFRFNFWNHIWREYDFSLGYLGKGISYAQRFMWHEWSNIKDLGEVTNLHNDVLCYYIGLGFFGFCLFFGMFFLGQVLLLKKWFSTQSAACAFSISVFYFVIMTTSNEGMPGFVYGCYMVLVLGAASDEEARLKGGG